MAMNIKIADGVNIDSEKKYAQGFHYVVKRKGEIVADIVGTHHFGEKPFCELNPEIKSVSIKAKKVAFESNFNFTQMQQVSSYTKTKHDKMEYYYEEFNKKNYDVTKVYKYPSLSAKRGVESLDHAYGAEKLIREACENANEVISLETPKEHAQARLCLKEWEILIEKKQRDGIISMEEINAATIDAYDAYLTGNETLEKQVMKWWKCQDPAFDYYIRKKRNYIFAGCAVPMIKKSSSENRILIAVGCTHLLGKHGVPKLLQQQLGNDYSVVNVMMRG